ncbi:MAG: citramalate synthase [Akkermansia sp.]|nr:citramalate synthase [Akkermansia sp.]
MAIKIDLYDTTLRDGAQSEDVNLSAADKVRIARELDFLGVDYIEGGWPDANPVETEFFRLMRDVELKNARLVAFGCTHHAGNSPENDPTMQALVSCGVRVATIFGKTCPRHVEVALGITKERNLEIVGNSVAYLKKHLDTVFFDAEHFFDGYHRDSAYAIKVLKAAYENGADCLILCDTNGGTMPDEISRVVAQVKENLPEARIGIHAHNDCELAVANSLAAVKAGATQVQGTMNGIGERCGNANLCSVIPNLQLKMEGYECLSGAALTRLKSTSAFVSEVSNLAPFRRQPFVGNAAFAHKGGVHVSAIMKDSALYEHMNPASVGNAQRVLMTEQGGKSNIMALARSLGIELDKGDPILELLSGAVKKNSALGYDYVAAPASAELLFLRHRHSSIKPYFKILRSVVLTSRHEMDPDMMVEATLKLKVNGQDVHTAAGGHGPVHALDRALRRALTQWYPELEQMHLIDYKVRVLSPTRTNIPDAEVDENGAGSNVRVLIESSDGVSTWTTVGVSYNIIEASLEALCDAISYKLYKAEHSRWRAEC